VFPKQLLLLALPFAIAACDGDGDLLDAGTDPNDAGINPQIDAGPIDSGPAFAVSLKSNLRIKNNLRLRNDVAQTLSLEPGSVCKELGLYSCTDFVHTVALGGVEAYELGLNEPQPNTTTTTPLAVERVVMAGCEQRVTKDLGTETVIFRQLGIGSDGKLDPSSPAAQASITELYHRALLRDPKARELEHFADLYRSIEADGAPNPGRDWAILTCFSVLTSLEALFY
jgi:hypothetical protein